MPDLELQKEHPRKRRRVSLAVKLNILIIAAIVGIAFGLVLMAFFLNGRQIQSLYMDELDKVARMCRLAVNEDRFGWVKEQICSEEFLAQKQKALLPALQGITDVEMDLEGLDYISSAGLRVLLAVEQTLEEKQGTLVIRNVGENVMDIFKITGFDEALHIV